MYENVPGTYCEFRTLMTDPVFFPQGPVPTTDFRLSGGQPGCTTEELSVKGGNSGTTYPTWMELINGDTYKVGGTRDKAPSE